MIPAPYVLDTCALTWAMRDAYPIEILPPFWERLSEAGASGLIVSNEMILHEIEKQDDDLYKWCMERKEIFKPMSQAIVNETQKIIRSFPTLININKEKDGADPFLIAQAITVKGVVVSQETPNGPKHPRMKIPDVCGQVGIRKINLLEMVKEFGWTFK